MNGQYIQLPSLRQTLADGGSFHELWERRQGYAIDAASVDPHGRTNRGETRPDRPKEGRFTVSRYHAWRDGRLNWVLRYSPNRIPQQMVRNSIGLRQVYRLSVWLTEWFVTYSRAAGGNMNHCRQALQLLIAQLFQKGCAQHKKSSVSYSYGIGPGNS